MPSLYGSPEHWVTRAKEAREMAASIADPAAKQAMIAIAENYEKIAKRAEAREIGIGDITEQTKQVCENLKAAVEAAGGTMADICRVDVFIRNMEHFEKIHTARRDYFKAPAPASTMVEVCKMTSPDALIEINAIAVVP